MLYLEMRLQNQIPGSSCLPANQALLQGKLTKERSKLEAESYIQEQSAYPLHGVRELTAL